MICVPPLAKFITIIFHGSTDMYSFNADFNFISGSFCELLAFYIFGNHWKWYHGRIHLIHLFSLKLDLCDKNNLQIN